MSAVEVLRMAITGMTSRLETVEVSEETDNAACPPHHWVIVERLEDGYHEERWECRRCGDSKFVRTATWETTGRKMNNNSTWTPEDKILGGDEEEEDL